MKMSKIEKIILLSISSLALIMSAIVPIASLSLIANVPSTIKSAFIGDAFPFL